MTRRTRAFLWIAAAGVAGTTLFSPGGTALAGSPDGVSDSLDQLGAGIPELMRAGDVPGLQIAIVRGGRFAGARSFGVQDAGTGAPVRDDTIFEAASLS